jgi:hypothetical protein
MPGIDIFNDDAFSVTSLLTAVDKVGYVPGLLGSIPGLFQPAPVRTEAIWIEARGTDAALIQTSARGEAPDAKSDSRRTATPFATKRLAKASRITASELARHPRLRHRERAQAGADRGGAPAVPAQARHGPDLRKLAPRLHPGPGHRCRRHDHHRLGGRTRPDHPGRSRLRPRQRQSRLRACCARNAPSPCVRCRAASRGLAATASPSWRCATIRSGTI